MRLSQRVDVLTRGGAESEPWFRQVCEEIQTAISLVACPPGADKFNIQPSEGNGIIPIKAAVLGCLIQRLGWRQETAPPTPSAEWDGCPAGAVKVVVETGQRFAVRWETGGVAYCHQAFNTLVLEILHGELAGGALILPSKKLHRFLRDWTCSFDKLQPFFPVWAKVAHGESCVLSVFEVEHDAEDGHLPLIDQSLEGVRGLKPGFS
jgi:hypothetical protein